jgi:hypothetical protein
MSAKGDPSCFGILDAIALPFGTDLCLKLGNRPEHSEKQPSGRVRGADLLIEHLQIDAFALQGLGDLAQVQGGAGKPIPPSWPRPPWPASRAACCSRSTPPSPISAPSLLALATRNRACLSATMSKPERIWLAPVYMAM